MKTKLLRKLRKQVNRLFICKGNYVYKWMVISGENEFLRMGYDSIYICEDEQQAILMCNKERENEMIKLVKSLRFKKNHKGNIIRVDFNKENKVNKISWE